MDTYCKNNQLYDGSECPVCGSTDITMVSSLNHYFGPPRVSCICTTCGATWEELLKVVGYEYLKVPD